MGAMKTRIWDDPVLTDIKVISGREPVVQNLAIKRIKL
jgi:hypothetical protein